MHQRPLKPLRATLTNRVVHQHHGALWCQSLGTLWGSMWIVKIICGRG